MVAANDKSPDTEPLIVEAVENEATFWSCPRLAVVRAMAHMEIRRLEHGEQLYVRGDNVSHTYSPYLRHHRGF